MDRRLGTEARAETRPGEALSESDSRDVNAEELLEFYSKMLLIRKTEEHIGNLVERGEARCPCHLYIGQEAVAVGVCATLRGGDTVWGTHRSHGHYLAQGGDVGLVFAEILGRATGCARGRGGSMHLFAPQQGIFGTVPIVAGTIPLAVGAGLAAKLRGDSAVAVAFFGDGATEEGHFHEALNLAALYCLPVVFVCENNLYASHMHICQRRVADNLSEMAAPYRIPAQCVDGNDVLAVYRAAQEAVQRARTGRGASFLECRTFRWRGHVGPAWDIDVGVKRREELQVWIARCPLKRTRRLLAEKGVEEQTILAVEQRIGRLVEEAEAAALNAPFPAEEELLDHVFFGCGEGHDA